MFEGLYFLLVIIVDVKLFLFDCGFQKWNKRNLASLCLENPFSGINEYFHLLSVTYCFDIFIAFDPQMIASSFQEKSEHNVANMISIPSYSSILV